MYHFLAGYTAKVAGTEAGVTEPQATFSPCFGAPFMALPPSTYAQLLGEKIEQHNVSIWLINTGWNGGPYGDGQRMKLALTRSMVKATLSGSLNDVKTTRDPVFGVHVPVEVPGVPAEVLDPRKPGKIQRLMMPRPANWPGCLRRTLTRTLRCSRQHQKSRPGGELIRFASSIDCFR